MVLFDIEFLEGVEIQRHSFHAALYLRDPHEKIEMSCGVVINKKIIKMMMMMLLSLWCVFSFFFL